MFISHREKQFTYSTVIFSMVRYSGIEKNHDKLNVLFTCANLLLVAIAKTVFSSAKRKTAPFRGKDPVF